MVCNEFGAWLIDVLQSHRCITISWTRVEIGAWLVELSRTLSFTHWILTHLYVSFRGMSQINYGVRWHVCMTPLFIMISITYMSFSLPCNFTNCIFWISWTRIMSQSILVCNTLAHDSFVYYDLHHLNVMNSLPFNRHKLYHLNIMDSHRYWRWTPLFITNLIIYVLTHSHVSFRGMSQDIYVCNGVPWHWRLTQLFITISII